MLLEKRRKRVDACKVVDLFAGVGGLTHGFHLEGFDVVLGIDLDEDCKYAYETNNPGARFVCRSIEDVRGEDIISVYEPNDVRILVGCAPCQPFSAYTRYKKGNGDRPSSWRLLYEFARLIEEVGPDIVSMENVPRLKTYDGGRVFKDFLRVLFENGYFVTYDVVDAAEYGVPQRRKRLVLIASKWGPVEFLRPTRGEGRAPYRTVREAIGDLPSLRAGETHPDDPLHKCMGLSDLNMKRIRASKPGGSWLDWPEELRASCHLRRSGRFYKNVYGRMRWDEPSPTITTQFYGFGNGRFGHPEQDRAISLREGALLQTFPSYFEFYPPDRPIPIVKVARWIGNAVPIALARAIAKSIRLHILKHRGWLRHHGETRS